MNDEPAAEPAALKRAGATTRTERFLLFASAALAFLLVIITVIVVAVMVPQSRETTATSQTSTVSTSVATPGPSASNTLQGPMDVVTTGSPPPTSLPTEPPSLSPTKVPTQPPTSPPTKLPTEPPSQPPTTPPSKAPTLPPTDSPVGTPLDLVYMTFYYPWYIADEWDRHGRQDDPLLGYYSTDDAAIAEQHIEWAKRAGIDVFVASWDGPDGPRETVHLRDGLFQASNVNDIQFCVLYESLGALPTVDFADGTALAKLISDMQWVEANYFTLPFYYRVNGRPVVYLYVTRDFINFTPEMLTLLNEAMTENVLWIADEPYQGDQKDIYTSKHGIKDDGSPFWEAYAPYNMFDDFLVNWNEPAVDYYMREALPIYEHWSESTLFFPQLMFQYHDWRGHPPLTGDAAGLIQQLQVFSCLKRPEWYAPSSFPTLLFITSFNEWWEGTQMEPDDGGRYDFEFIDALKEFKDSGYTCPGE